MTRTRVVAGCLAGLVLLAGCSDDENGEAGPTEATEPGTSSQETDDDTTTSAEGETSEPAADPVQDVVDEVYGDAEAEAVATLSGSLPRNEPEVTAEVLSVSATETGTVLRWRLSSADGQAHTLDRDGGVVPAEEDGFAPYVDVRDVRIIDPSTEEYSEASSYTRVDSDDAASSYCLCSDLPSEVSGTPVELSGVYAPLGEDVTEVTVQIPGLGEAEGVPVTR